MPGKLKLNLEQLTVDSFATETQKAEKGTVFGEQCTCFTVCTCPDEPSVIHCPTHNYSCAGTCGCHTWLTECDGCAATCMATACDEGPCCG